MNRKKIVKALNSFRGKQEYDALQHGDQVAFSNTYNHKGVMKRVSGKVISGNNALLVYVNQHNYKNWNYLKNKRLKASFEQQFPNTTVVVSLFGLMSVIKSKKRVGSNGDTVTLTSRFRVLDTGSCTEETLGETWKAQNLGKNSDTCAGQPIYIYQYQLLEIP